MEEYYVNQAGNGIPIQVFYGTRSQRGNGFFGRLISRTVLPLLRYLGTKAFETGKNMYEDFKSGIDLGDSFKNRGLDTLQTIVNDGIQTIRQKGNGIKRTRSRRSVQSKKRSRRSKPVSTKKSNAKKLSSVKKKKKLRKKKVVKKKCKQQLKPNTPIKIPDFL